MAMTMGDNVSRKISSKWNEIVWATFTRSTKAPDRNIQIYISIKIDWTDGNCKGFVHSI